jgi:hypothetical protein
VKLTLSWLKDHLDTDASLEAMCERLTMIGLEVESVDSFGTISSERELQLSDEHNGIFGLPRNAA